MKKGFFIILALLASVTAQAFPPVPKESATALRRTKGKTISTGLVFVNGKFLRPPYVVERWGTGIRINGTPVTGQVIAWSEFLKTQDSSAVAVEAAPAPQSDSAPGGLPPPPTDEPPAETAPEPGADAETMPVAPPEPANDATLDEILSLDDLFDAEGDAAAKKSAPKASKPKAKPRAPKPKAPPPPEMKLTGAFVRNDASKALVAKINAARTEIDRQLRNGALLCFGDNYVRIVGDAKAAELILKTLPDAEMKAESAEDLQRMLRAARLDYLHELIVEDFFANRIDYRRLQDYRKKLREDREMDKMIEATKKSF
jgi:hypothetical protein